MRIDDLYLFANVVAQDSNETRFGLGKRHASADHKTSLCGRYTVSDTAWIGPLLCESLISCASCVAAWKRLKEYEQHGQLGLVPSGGYVASPLSDEDDPRLVPRRVEA